MADMSKAEKLAAARKKLKEYQLKPKDSNKPISSLKNTNQEASNGKGAHGQSSFTPEAAHLIQRVPDESQKEVADSYNQIPQLPVHNDNNENPSNNAADSFGHPVEDNKSTYSFNGSSFGHAPIGTIPTPIIPAANDFFDNLPTQNTNWFSRENVLESSFSSEHNATQSNYLLQNEPTESPAASSSEHSPNDYPTAGVKLSAHSHTDLAQNFFSSDNLNFNSDIKLTEPQDLILKSQTPEPNNLTENILTSEQTSGNNMEQYFSSKNNSLPELSIPESNPFSPEQQQYAMSFITPDQQTGSAEEYNPAFDSPLVQSLTTEQTDLHLSESSLPKSVQAETAVTTVNNDSHPSKIEHAALVTQQAPVSPRSTAENIRQLSMQMNGLIAEGSLAPGKAERNELESRNQELAALLDLERQRSEQLQQHLHEYESRLAQVSAETEAARAAGEAHGKREVAALHEQLQLHAQTLGILVAEKTELQASLAQFQAAARQKTSDAEELKSRLNASRHRVGDLEKELSALRTSAEHNETLRQTVTIEFEQLKREQALVTLRLQETLEEREEISHRLSTKAAECSTIGQELFETKSQLSLAQLRVDQLSSHTSPEDTSHLEALYQEKINLEHKVADLEIKLASVEAKEEEKYKQYQLYVTSMDEQLHSLTDRNERLAAENHQLAQRETSLVSHVTGLEKRLQDAMREPSVVHVQPNAELERKVMEVEEEKGKLEELLALRLQANKALETSVNERDTRIEELESFLDRMQGDQPDQARLLAAMESDKVAASRAVSQNQFLKQELEEIQNKNIQLSDSLCDVTDKLQHERHVSRELTQRLAEQETWISQLNEELAAKPEKSVTSESHHYDDHGQIADILHRELAQTKDRIEALTQQNSELRALLTQGQSAIPDGEDERDVQIRRLTAERDDLVAERSADGSEPPPSRYAMAQLQERFTSTMREVAELSDEKQRLEHLVLQLQGETETIGEYIALYQKQRSLLRERADEKDTQLKCLSQDREEMRGKLAQLNELIRRLVAERGSEETDAVLGNLSAMSNGELEEMRHQAAKSELPTETEVPTPKADTADEIMALLTEIGSSNLIDPQQLVEHFHPCAWCSGRLITV